MGPGALCHFEVNLVTLSREVWLESQRKVLETHMSAAGFVGMFGTHMHGFFHPNSAIGNMKNGCWEFVCDDICRDPSLPFPSVQIHLF